MPDRRARIAVDLGAESCRVSVLRWVEDRPTVRLVHRFRHVASESGGALRWDLAGILAGVDEGLQLAVEEAPEGVASIGVDGWAVDYVRIGAREAMPEAPFCYRDPRTQAAERGLHARVAPERLRELTAVQLQPLNTVYQHHADALEGRGGAWLNLPEYLLYRWGGAAVAERTNATHTGMVGVDGAWCAEVFRAAGCALRDAPRLVEPGTDVGAYAGAIAALRGARLIAPCCHDTASAIAGIPDEAEDWAYLSSGTWSLVGTVLPTVCNTAEAARENFTNLGAAGGRVLFHKGLPGLWLLQQCMRTWGREDVVALVREAREAEPGRAGDELDLSDAALLQPGDMPERINGQRAARGLARVEGHGAMTRLVLQSLAAGYAEVLRAMERITGKPPRRLYVVGGGAQNELLNEMTAQATGLQVVRGAVESATVGNLAVQLALAAGDATAAGVARMASLLQD